jgi:hypothetical protein
MKQNRIWLTLGILLISILLLSACSLSGNNQPVEESLPPELPEDTESLVMLAKFDLTLKTGVDIEKIATKSIKETLFDDASLGVPEPGVTYEAVGTPGYIITLEAGGDLYEYHASGARVVQVPTEE